MDEDTEPDRGEAPDAVDRLLGRPRRIHSLPRFAHPSLPPVLGPPTPTIEEASATRTLAAEVVSTPSHVYVTVEILGASKDTIDILATDRHLEVRAPRSQGAPFYLDIDLPERVRPETARATYWNGVLDVTLDRPRSAGGDVHDG